MRLSNKCSNVFYKCVNTKTEKSIDINIGHFLTILKHMAKLNKLIYTEKQDTQHGRNTIAVMLKENDTILFTDSLYVKNNKLDIKTCSKIRKLFLIFYERIQEKTLLCDFHN